MYDLCSAKRILNYSVYIGDSVEIVFRNGISLFRQIIIIIMASQISKTNPTVDKVNLQKQFRQDRCSHFCAIGSAIEKIVHRSENPQFKEECLRLLRITSTTNQNTIKSVLIELVEKNHLKK